MNPARAVSVAATTIGLWLVLASPDALAVSVKKLALSGSRLEFEVRNATPNATIYLDHVARGAADGKGEFRTEISPFSSLSCVVSISDVSASDPGVSRSVSGCTPSGPICGNGSCEVEESCSSCSADCGACAPVCGNTVCELSEDCSSCTADCGVCSIGALPVFASHNPAGLPGSSLAYRATVDHGQPTAFVFDWADGSQTRDPGTGFWSPEGGIVLGAFVHHAWSVEGIYEVTVTAIDDLGATATSAPVAVTIAPGSVCGDAICDPTASETCVSCTVDCGVCPPVCNDGVCDSSETCLTCSPDCGLCTHAGNETVAGFTPRIGVLPVGGSTTWQLTNPPGITLEGSTATLYRNPGTPHVANAHSVEELWFWLNTPARMARAEFDTSPLAIDESNRFSLSNPDGSTWPLGSWTFFLAWELADGTIVVTPPTQVIVPSEVVQDPWSLFGGPFDQPGHAEWYQVSQCPFFTDVAAQTAYYIPFDFCPPGQDCTSYGYIFPVYEYSDGWTSVQAPSFVTGVGFQALGSTHAFSELGNYQVSANLWDQSMSNESNTVSSVLHVHQFEPICPDGLCNGFETFNRCPEDCAASCGDAVCGAGEDCTNCAADCGTCSPVCGDLICDCPVGNFPGESCSNCVADCGPCTPPCGDGDCDRFSEDCSSCAADCGTCPGENPSCGDAICDAGEDCTLCSADCGPCAPVCGDGACEVGEDCGACSVDCGVCPPACGDGTCDVGESCLTCSADCGACGPVCGDGSCDVGEDCGNCGPDCGTCSTCGNNICDASETCSSCSSDCQRRDLCVPGAQCCDGRRCRERNGVFRCD